ncbi:MAG: thiamine-phosphate diphosphorylase [Planctomycetes bacterium TMED75]|nr:thiamine phosphate synthase [Planctomycetaceae bacterium]OUU91056.1 MAG: thiamine-phosphate diphosphorylase [Planctomycetes bacterium TMED75]
MTSLACSTLAGGGEEARIDPMPPPPHHSARILDASANRAREALRVLEDGARFLLDDRALIEEFKQLRHQLHELVGSLPPGMLEHSRAVEADQGRTVTTSGEFIREHSEAVVRAAASRASESLRSLEEWSKTIRPETARGFEAIRYRSYEAAATLIQELARGCAQWRVCLLLTEAACRAPWEQVLEGAIDGGIDCVQIREKELSDERLLQRVRQTISIARPRGVCVVVNDRVDIALAAEADGVHLGQGDLPLAEARDLAGERLLIGSSTHDPEEVAEAIEAGCDLVGVGAIFPSRTKQALETSGPGFFERFIAEHPGVAHLAIGGIDARGAAQLAHMGCRGVAVSSAICDATDPALAARAIVEAMSPSAVSPETHP